MRTLILAVTIAFMSSAFAYAQPVGVGGVPDSSRKKGESAAEANARKKERVDSERAYKKALDGIPDAQKPYDPWRNVRP